MAYHAHSLTEWAAFLSLGLSAISVIALVLAFAEANAAYFDPRPALHRLIESGRLDPLLIEVVRARQLVRETAVSVAALLMLLNSGPEATR